MDININNLPEDFYGNDDFPLKKYIFDLQGINYSILSYCDTPYGKGKISGINKLGINIIIEGGKNNGSSFFNVSSNFIKIIPGIYDKFGNLSLQFEHNINYNFILNELNKEEKFKNTHLKNLNNILEMSNNDKMEYNLQGGILEEYDDSKLSILLKIKGNAYFYCLLDEGVLTYISSHGNLTISKNKIIEKYTSSRWGLLKKDYSLGTNRVKLTVEEDRIIKIEQDKEESKRLVVSQDNFLVEYDSFKKKEDLLTNTKGMGDISSLMILEQDEVMRSDFEGVTLISGVAGSGKTNILLHRIDYFLSEFPKIFNESKIVVFCYNIGLKNYVSNMIHNSFPNVNVYNKDKYFQDQCINFCGKRFNYNNEHFTNIDIVNLYIELMNSIKNNQLYIDKEIKKVLNEKEKKLKLGNKIENINYIYSKKNKNGLEKTFIISFYSFFEGKNISKDKFDFILYFLSSLKIEKKTYLNKRILYIELNNEYYNEKIELNLGNSFVYDKKEYFVFIENISGLSIKNFDHIFIDEVQDLKPLEIKIFNNLHNNGMTLAGDKTQIIFNNNYENFADYFGIKINRLYEIKNNHRSSLQIVLFANQFLNNVKGALKADSVGFTGNKPKIIISNDSKNRALVIKKILKSITLEGKKICIIHNEKEISQNIVNYLNNNGFDTYYAEKGNWNFSKNIHVTNYFQVKGLEFDNVILLGSNNFFKSWIGGNKNQILYTISTRAKENLYIIDNEFGIYGNFESSTYDIEFL